MSQPIEVIGGIDTHTDVHQAAVIATIGRHLATEAFPTTTVGYRDCWSGCSPTAKCWW